jgi:hypothetical protein
VRAQRSSLRAKMSRTMPQAVRACTFAVAIAVAQMQAGHKGVEERKVHFGLVVMLKLWSTPWRLCWGRDRLVFGRGIQTLSVPKNVRNGRGKRHVAVNASDRCVCTKP